MKKILSVDNMRKSDAHCIATKVPSKELMLRAAKAIYNEVLELLDTGQCKAPIGIICGYGNNAGDGYALASLLFGRGIEVEVILLGAKFSEDGKYYFDHCLNCGLPILKFGEDISNLSSYPCLIDCIFGTGFKGEVRGAAEEAIRAMNKSGAYVISVDMNSGLNGDSGMVTSEDKTLAVTSDLTLSIGDFKPGHFLNMAKDLIKKKKNLDIGIRPVSEPYYLFEIEDLSKAFLLRKNLSNKSTYGYVGLIGGSAKYQGAIKLAALSNAAMRSGAGVVRIGLPRTLYPHIAPNVLEGTIFPLSDEDGELIFVTSELDELIHNCKTLAFGMGIGLSKGARETLHYLLQNYDKTLIIDADGLTLLSELDKEEIKKARCNLVLSPHNKEFSRLSGLDIEDILAHPIERVKAYLRSIEEPEKARSRVLILKGPSTIISDTELTYIVDAGCPGMATAGSGDVLSGVLSALCVNSKNLAFSAAASCFICGKAGERAEEKVGPVSLIASDTVKEIAPIIKSAYENK